MTNTTVSSNSSNTTSSGGGIYIYKGSVDMTNSTVSSNRASSGGGIFNLDSVVTLINSTVSSNMAENGGGILIYSSGPTSSMDMTNSTVSSNTASSNGGGIYNLSGSVVMTTTTVSRNMAQDGGGLYNYDSGSMDMTNTTVSSNTALEGGGIFNQGEGSVVTLINSTVSSNTATHSAVPSGVGGGGIYNKNNGSVAITNSTVSSNTAISGGGIFNQGEGSVVTLINSTVSSNSATSASFGGGGIFNEDSGSVVITNSTVSSNTTSANGGGIFNEDSGSVAITNSTVSSNSATDSLGGGGIYNKNNGSVDMTNTTVSSNTASNGGGIFIYNASVDMTTSTVSSNSASSNGGGILNLNSVVALINSTVSSNSASSDGGGIYSTIGSTVTVRSSIVANSLSGNNCANSGTMISNGYNLSSDSSCTDFNATGDMTNTNPLLGPLAANGGPSAGVNGEQPMLTHALLSGSPALAGAECVSGLTTDQRGESRPNPTGSLCDIGAYELSLTVPQFSLDSAASADLTGVRWSNAAWGDYDNDGDLDILLTGYTSGYDRIAQVYQNTGSGGFTVVYTLTGVTSSSVAWGDYDNDGDLDILLSGWNGATVIAQVYENTGSGGFTVAHTLTGVANSSVAWGDYDNDGDLDILLTGSGIAQVYENTGSGGFIVAHTLTGVDNSSVAWGDYDNDGDLDILLTGCKSNCDSSIAWVYKNTGNGFTNINAGLPGVYNGSVAWGDYDNDGDLDILLTGSSTISGLITEVYENTGNGGFIVSHTLPGIQRSSVAWGDYDNDGDLDILLSGCTSSLCNKSRITRVYENTGSGFTDISAGLTGIEYGSVAWGDYDNDGDLDILLIGHSGRPTAEVYQNNNGKANTPPITPAGLSSSVNGAQVDLSWAAVTDTQTISNAGLTYNLRVGTSTGLSNTLVPMACVGSCGGGSDGYRQIPAIGAANHGLTATLIIAQTGTYYWSVQAIDPAFAGSPWAAEGTFTVVLPDLSISKSVSPATAVPGDTITYTLTFSNAGDSTATGVVITDYIPISVTHSSLNFTSSGATITATGSNSYVWEVEDLSPNEWGLITITGTLSDNLSAGTLLTNMATITTTSVDNDPTNNSDSAGVTVVVPGSDLSIAKAVNPNTAQPGQIITYTIRYANNGLSTATDVRITDNMPISITGATVDGTSGPTLSTVSGETFAWTLSALATNETGSITITGQISSALTSDTNFDNTALITSSIAETNNDDNHSTAAIAVTIAEINFSGSSYMVDETGGSATITVTLSGAMPVDVSVTYSSSDNSATAGSDYQAVNQVLTFIAGSTQQTFMVPIMDDSVAEGNETITLDLSNPVGAKLGSTTQASLTITDDDIPAVLVGAISGNTTEAGDTASFTMTLQTQPTDNVTITMQSSNIAEGIVMTPTNSYSVVFNTGDWNSSQTVVISGVDDFVADGNQTFDVTINNAQSSDASYNGMVISDVTGIINVDNDSNGFDASVSGNTTESGGTANYQIRLAKQPTATVSVALTSTNTAEGTFTASLTLNFTTDNWNVYQMVVVTGVDDAVSDGNVSYNIRASSSNGGYDGLTSDTPVLNLDNDTANTPPIAEPDFVTTAEDSPVLITPLINDTDSDGDTLVISKLYTQTKIHGQAAISGTTQIIYTPTLNFNGVVSLTYEVSDGSLTDSSSITITVEPVNDAPQAEPDSVTTAEDRPVLIMPLSNDSDSDEDQLFISELYTQTEIHGQAIISGSTEIIYTPTLNFNGVISLIYIVSDGSLSDTSNITITVEPVNDAPQAEPDSVTTTEDTAVLITPLINDTDSDGDTLSISKLYTQTKIHGQAAISGSTEIIYTPTLNFNGVVSLTYIVSDSSLTDTTTVTITVTPVNDTPIARADVATTPQDTAVSIPVLDNDSDPENDPLNLLQIMEAATHGTTTVEADGTVSYTPEAGYVGLDSFVYRVGDGNGGVATAEVTISVTASDNPNPPVIIPIDPTITQTIVITPPIDVIDSTVILTIPVDIAEDEFVLVYTRLATNSHGLPTGQGLEYGFKLEAFVNGVLQSGFVFSRPLTLTIQYTDQQVAQLIEETLHVRYWNVAEQAWKTDGIVTISHDMARNEFTITIAHLTEFGLFGESQNRVYMPVMLR
ncbi:Ig-like domain-containing protein [Anaerolineales bacterium HSG25]|nr:Ig-like domain-containing protein [Anaerolineales bacterium HSG25]